MNKRHVLGCTLGNICRLILLSVMLASASFVWGQTTFGRISGTVSDAAGASVPNATVTITNPATNFSRVVTTNSEGFYTVTNLPVGSYNVLVEAPNFKKSMSAGNPLSADA